MGGRPLLGKGGRPHKPSVCYVLCVAVCVVLGGLSKLPLYEGLLNTYCFDKQIGVYVLGCVLCVVRCVLCGVCVPGGDSGTKKSNMLQTKKQNAHK